MKKSLLLLLFLTMAVAAHPFTFSSPEHTWATFKFALDTGDHELFMKCLVESERRYFTDDEFEKFLEGDGRLAQASRVVKVTIEGDQAVLSVDFFGRNRAGKPLLDNDPIKMKRVDGKWLLDGL